MWRRRTDSLAIGFSATQVAWQFAGGTSQTTSAAVHAGGLERVAATIEASSLPSRIAAVQVAAGSSVARHWLQAVPPGLRSFPELQALVQSRADQLFGGDVEWVVAADWHATRPFLCAALPREVGRWASAIARSAGAGCHLTTSLALALVRHTRDLPTDGWTALHEPEVLHLLYFEAGNLAYTRTAVMPADIQAAALEHEAQVETARSAALAGGLPTVPMTLLSLSKEPGEAQATTALGLAASADRKAP